MNKKIIAVALAGAFVTPLAMADVTLYGVISASVEGVGTSAGSGTGVNLYANQTRVEDQNSRIGFKGMEDLGNGTSTIWQVESSLKNFEQGGTNDKGETATLGTRNTFIGLSDKTLGTVRMGYYDSVYKRYSNVGADLLPDATASIMGSSAIAGRGEARLQNSVHYDSPVWAGFQVGASYGFDEATTATNNRSRVSLGANYTNGPLKAAVAYDRQGSSALTVTGIGGVGGNSSTVGTTGVDTNFARIAASYKFDFGTMIAANFERASYGNSAGAGNANLTQNGWTLTASQTFGNATIGVSYSKLGDLNNVTNGSPADYDAKQWVLSGTYNLSKQTQLAAYATRITNNAGQLVNFGNDPLYAVPGTTSPTKLSNGSTLHAIGAGIRYAF
ncbi:porin [Paludibacterium purpuratum]|uniref:Putative porin n=1 Tax=Paludibacterium purpuratum TaxID=1144873 RepID=A0A4R7B7H1_9NEIS|nr:porin [Paludibacterium purpuratum]TDR79782.1 putative porin [Paludibacterium purpuratum]